ncbi:hypothetical protein R3P38DRAFT_3237038 [Favolaschia claudopus]|uniref:RING-type domain-containing protein n=1 Tax=Favolaschia claudopus TaxID=2862362 RepID=A0AAV9ZCR8_9AGAR
MVFPRARLYQRTIEEFLRPAAVPRVSAVDAIASSSAPAAPNTVSPAGPFSQYRHFHQTDGTKGALAIDVDLWDSLPPLDVDAECDAPPVELSAKEPNVAETSSLPPPEPSQSASTVEDDVSELFVCSICLDTFNLPVVTLCMHVFCDACMSRCLDRSNECPMCRRAIIARPIRDELFEDELEVAIEIGSVSAPMSCIRSLPYIWPSLDGDLDEEMN